MQNSVFPGMKLHCSLFGYWLLTPRSVLIPLHAVCVITVCFVIRYLSSCGILMTRVPPLLGAAMPGRGILLPARSFFNLADSFSKRKEYSERRIIGSVCHVCFHSCDAV